MWGITIDDTTLLLSLCIAVALVLGAAQTRVLQPALHPLVLARQGVPARVRAFQHSPVFRNANAPPGCHLAIRPRAAAQTVTSLARLGARTSAVTGTIGLGSGSGTGSAAPASGRPSAPRPNAAAPTLSKPRGGMEMLSLAAQLAAGIRVSANSNGNLAVVLSAGRVTDLAAATLLLPAVETVETNRITLFVLPPGPVPHCGPYGPMPIPVLSTTAKDLHAGLLDTPMLAKVSIVIVPDTDLEQAQTVSGIQSKQLLTLSQVAKSAEGSSELATVVEALASIPSTPAPGTDAAPLTKPQSVYTHYYLPQVKRWARITEANLTSAVTAHLGAFAPDAIPTQRDRIGVVSSVAAEGDADAPLLSPLVTAAGLGFLLLSVYTGAGIQFDQDASADDGVWRDGPTMLYTTPVAARAVATACVSHCQSSFFGTWATRAALYRLRHGALPPRIAGAQPGSGTAGAMWDWIYFRSARRFVVPHLRSVRHATIISSTGRTVGQNTLDVLRAFLGAPVVHAYLPAAAQVAGYEKLDQDAQPLSDSEIALSAAALGVPPGTAAVFTAPVSVSHAADLQAFDHGPFGAAHVGPPSVAAEVQLSESRRLRQQGWTIEPVDANSKEAEQLHTRWPDDPAGAVLARGPITALAFHAAPSKIPDPLGFWISTSEVGSFRPNGTLVLVASHDLPGTVVQNVVEDAPALGDVPSKGSRVNVYPERKKR